MEWVVGITYKGGRLVRLERIIKSRKVPIDTIEKVYSVKGVEANIILDDDTVTVEFLNQVTSSIQILSTVFSNLNDAEAAYVMLRRFSKIISSENIGLLVGVDDILPLMHVDENDGNVSKN